MTWKDHLLVRYTRLLLLSLLLSGSARLASAQATNVETRALANPREVAEATRGPKFGLTAGPFFRSPEHHVGFALSGDFYYDFRLGPVVLAPGLRATGYVTQDFLAIAGLGTLRAGLSLGPVLPYLLGGVGIGFIGHENDTGASYLGGGGVLLTLRRRLAVGLEVSYQGFATTPFRATYFGPNMQFSY
ncbi:MAG: hypothetical protein QM778_15740 [Myxococcales bacterium]